jgi:hypothetical protein
MRLPERAIAQRPRKDVIATAAAVVLITALTLFGTPSTGAVFSGDYPQAVTISAGQIFPDERTTAAFSVTDRSSGSAIDASSPLAFVGDGLIATMSPAPTAFDGGRYIEFRFDQPLPGNVALSSASFDVSGATTAGTLCVYFEVRDSNGSLLDTQGSAGVPFGCTSSSSTVTLVLPLSALSTTDLANGARVRAFVANGAGGQTLIDQAVLRATYNSQQFTLNAVDVIDVSDGSPSIDHWGLAGS